MHSLFFHFVLLIFISSLCLGLDASSLSCLPDPHTESQNETNLSVPSSSILLPSFAHPPVSAQKENLSLASISATANVASSIGSIPRSTNMPSISVGVSFSSASTSQLLSSKTAPNTPFSCIYVGDVLSNSSSSTLEQKKQPIISITPVTTTNTFNPPQNITSSHSQKIFTNTSLSSNSVRNNQGLSNERSVGSFEPKSRLTVSETSLISKSTIAPAISSNITIFKTSSKALNKPEPANKNLSEKRTPTISLEVCNTLRPKVQRNPLNVTPAQILRNTPQSFAPQPRRMPQNALSQSHISPTGISSLRTTLPSNSQQPPSLDSQNTPANSIQDTESLSMPIINENWAPSLSTNEPSCSTTISTTTTSTIKLSAEFKKRSGLNVIPAARMSQFGIASTQPSIDQPIAPAPVAATTSVLDQPKVSHTAAVSTAATTFPASNLATQANLKHAAAMVKSPLDLMQHYQQSNIGTLHYKPPFTQQGQLRPNQNRAMHIAPVLLQPSVNPNFQDQRQGILTGLHAQTQLRPTGQQALQGQVRSSGQHVLQGQIRQSGPHVLQGQIRPSGSHVLQGQIGPSGPHAKAQVGPTGIYVPQSLAFPNRHPYVPISNQPLMSNPAMQIRTPHHQQNMLVQQFSNTNTSDVNLRAGPNISLPQSSAIHYSHNQPGRQILATPSQPSPGQSINVSSTSAEEISNCFLCGKTATIKCCNLFVYCSQSCKDWDSSRHKSECEARR